MSNVDIASIKHQIMAVLLSIATPSSVAGEEANGHPFVEDCLPSDLPNNDDSLQSWYDTWIEWLNSYGFSEYITSRNSIVAENIKASPILYSNYLLMIKDLELDDKTSASLRAYRLLYEMLRNACPGNPSVYSATCIPVQIITGVVNKMREISSQMSGLDITEIPDLPLSKALSFYGRLFPPKELHCEEPEKGSANYGKVWAPCPDIPEDSECASSDLPIITTLPRMPSDFDSIFVPAAKLGRST